MNGKMKHERWSKDMTARLLELWNDGVSYNKISSELCTGKDCIYDRIAYMKRKGVIPKGRRRAYTDPYSGVRTVWTTRMEHELIRMKKDGYKHEVIAKELGCSKRAVYNKILLLRKAGRLKSEGETL